MTSVKVIKGFYDLAEDVRREPGDSFDATDERAAEIAAKLAGYVEVSPKRTRRSAKPKE